jgi:hypothetical protein
VLACALPVGEGDAGLSGIQARNLIFENLGAVVAPVDALVDSQSGKLAGIEVDFRD